MEPETQVNEAIFNNPSALVDEIVTKVKAAKENGDSKVLVTALKQNTEKICKETFLDGNVKTLLY